MRQIAKTKNNIHEAVRVMVHDTAEGVYLFTFSRHEDSDCNSDFWYETADEALEFCEDYFGVSRHEWEQIPDPPEGCQQDWIAPVRVRIHKEAGRQIRRYEALVGEVWVEIRRDDS